VRLERWTNEGWRGIARVSTSDGKGLTEPTTLAKTVSRVEEGVGARDMAEVF